MTLPPWEADISEEELREGFTESDIGPWVNSAWGSIFCAQSMGWLLHAFYDQLSLETGNPLEHVKQYVHDNGHIEVVKLWNKTWFYFTWWKWNKVMKTGYIRLHVTPEPGPVII